MPVTALDLWRELFEASKESMSQEEKIRWFDLAGKIRVLEQSLSEQVLDTTAVKSDAEDDHYVGGYARGYLFNVDKSIFRAGEEVQLIVRKKKEAT